MNITLKKLSIQKKLSEETLCFSADVCLDGKKVGEVSNRGHGGCNEYQCFDHDTLNELTEYAKKKHPDLNFEQLDALLDDIITEMQTNAQYKRWCKKETLFHLKTDPEGVFKVVKAVYAPEVVQYITKKYGEQVEYILNEKLLTTATA